MTYQTAFPDFDDMPTIPASWIDSSYHNDSCPSFEIMTGGKGDSNYDSASVWIDYANPDNRDIPGPRFSVVYYDDKTARSMKALQTDSWSEVLAYVQIRQAMGAAYTAQVGYNPFLDDPAIDPAEVLQTLLGHVAATYTKES